MVNAFQPFKTAIGYDYEEPANIWKLTHLTCNLVSLSCFQVQEELLSLKARYLEVDEAREKQSRSHCNQLEELNRREEMNLAMHQAEMESVCNYYEEQQMQLESKFQNEKEVMNQDRIESERALVAHFQAALAKKDSENNEMRNDYEKR